MRDAPHGMSRSKQRSGGGGRTIGFGLLAVLVALLVAYLGRCLPGFGTGGAPSTGPATPDTPATDTRAKQPADTDASTIAFTVRGDTCAVGDQEAVACDTLCASLPGEYDTARPVVVNAAHGTHSAVERLRECLGAAGFSNVALRTE